MTAVITTRPSDIATSKINEGANYVPRHLLTMSCNQSLPTSHSHQSPPVRHLMSRDIVDKMDSDIGCFWAGSASRQVMVAPSPPASRPAPPGGPRSALDPAAGSLRLRFVCERMGGLDILVSRCNLVLLNRGRLCPSIASTHSRLGCGGGRPKRMLGLIPQDQLVKRRKR
jgi:hypothetical protein